MKTYAGFELLKHGNPGKAIYVTDKGDSVELFKTVLREFKTNYHLTTIFRTICLLNSDSLRGFNVFGNKRTIQSGNIRMAYELASDAVFIHALVIEKVGPAKTGLYSVEYDKNRDEWKPKKEPAEGLKEAATWQSNVGQANYVAVSGSFDDIRDASNMMPQHLIGAYQKANMLTQEGAAEGKEYALFWSEKGNHKSQDAAQSLASIMQQSTKNGLPINWLIHGEGIHTYIKATKIIKTSPLADAAALKKNPDAGKVKDQNVFFSNPSSSVSESKLKELAQDAGLTYQGYHTNYRDLKRLNTWKKAGSALLKYSSAGYIAGGGITTTVAKVTATSGAGKHISAIFNGMSNGDYIMIGAGAVAGGYLVVDAAKRSKTLFAGVSCTVGRGNDKWYVDDAALYA